MLSGCVWVDVICNLLFWQHKNYALHAIGPYEMNLKCFNWRIKMLPHHIKRRLMIDPQFPRLRSYDVGRRLIAQATCQAAKPQSYGRPQHKVYTFTSNTRTNYPHSCSPLLLTTCKHTSHILCVRYQTVSDLNLYLRRQSLEIYKMAILSSRARPRRDTAGFCG